MKGCGGPLEDAQPSPELALLEANANPDGSGGGQFQLVAVAFVNAQCSIKVEFPSLRATSSPSLIAAKMRVRDRPVAIAASAGG